jgi:putative membrane protein
MPMTYSVNVFKEVISGIDYGFLGENAMILIGIIIAFLLASFLISKLTADKNPSQEEVAAGV